MPLGAIPYVVGVFLALAIVAGAGVKGYLYGRESREDEVVELRAGMESARRFAEEARERGEAAAKRAKAQYEAKAKTIRIEAENTTKLVEVIRRETPGDCVLPPAFSRLWDGPGVGEAADSSGVDGPSVALAEVAESAAEARRRFELNAAKLEALQKLLQESGGDNNKQD